MTPPEHIVDRLTALLEEDGPIEITDVGASNISRSEVPSYTGLLSSGVGRLTAFEPNLEEFKKLQDTEVRRYLPYAIGSGHDVVLNITRSPGFCSTLTPNAKINSQIRGFSKYSRITSTEQMKTHRLDDLSEIERIDFMKIDIQGGELGAFEGAREKLGRCLCVQTEVAFVPIYENQPLFSEQDVVLRSLGFHFFALSSIHRFAYEGTPKKHLRRFGRSSLLQWIDADAVYLRDFSEWQGLDSVDLKRLFVILLLCFQAESACLRLGQILHDRKEIPTDLLDQLTSAILNG